MNFSNDNKNNPFSGIQSDKTIFAKPNAGRVNQQASAPAQPQPATPNIASNNNATETSEANFSLIDNLLNVTDDGQTDDFLTQSFTGLLLVGSSFPNLHFKPDQLPRLREKLISAIEALVNKLDYHRVEFENKKDACYLVCSYLDEAAANTPWGSHGIWSQQGLLLHFFKENNGGQTSFVLINKFLQQPEKYQPLLNLSYRVLSLGFMGRYHLEPDGHEKVSQLRHHIFNALAHNQTFQTRQAERWQTPFKPSNKTIQQLPHWLIPVAGLTICGIAYASFQFELNKQSDEAFQSVASLKTPVFETVAAKPPKPAQSTVKFLRDRLAPHIIAGNLQISFEQGALVLTLTGDGLFETGSTTINQAYKTVLNDVGKTLSGLKKPILITGHTDNIPIRTLKFPSNWHLSTARAKAVGDFLNPFLAENNISTEGAGATSPLSSNKTATGRADNRRVEIILTNLT